MQYLYEANQVIDQMTRGHSKTITQKAFFDTLGGYLRHYMVPISMYSFYAGLIKLRTVENILELYDQSKSFLNTNGNGWKTPIKDYSDFDIQIDPLRIVVGKKQDEDTSCTQLELQDDRSAESEDMIIALPRLDPEENGILGNIWLPFKRRRTFNLKNTKSAFVLLRYFELTTRCYHFQGICQDTFNRKFKNWILENLDIHLKDDVFYPGLGATLRIVETLRMTNGDFVVLDKRQRTQNYKALETRAKQLERHSKDWLGNVFGKGDILTSLDGSTDSTPKQNKSTDDDDDRRMIYIYATIIVIVLILVFVISVAYIVKWSNTPLTDSDVQKPPNKKERRVTIDEELGRLSYKNDEEEVLLEPNSSSIVSSAEISRPSKLNKSIAPKSARRTSTSTNCFPLCTRRNSLELDKPILSMESDSANEESLMKESSDQQTVSRISDTSNVQKDLKYVSNQRRRSKKTNERNTIPEENVSQLGENKAFDL